MASATLPKGALWMQNVNYPASWDRTLIDALFLGEGVIDGFAVTPQSGLTIDISPGRAIVQGDEVANQGKYLIDSDAVVSLTVASVGADRTEYVYLAVNDAAVAGGRAGDNVTIETSETPPADTTLIIATLNLLNGTATITAGMISDDRSFTGVVPPESITAAEIATGAVGTDELADDAVTQPKIGPNAVGSTELGSSAVQTANIADDAVTADKLAPGAVSGGGLDDGAVTTAKIADDAVTQPKIGPGAVGSTELASDAVTNAKIATNAVNQDSIAASAVGNSELAADAVTGAKIANDAINSEHYVNGSIDNAHLANDSVTDAKIGAPTTTTTTNGGTTFYFARYGSLVLMTCSGSAKSAGTYSGVVPSGYRPPAGRYVNLESGQLDGLASIDSSGQLSVIGWAFPTGAWSLV